MGGKIYLIVKETPADRSSGSRVVVPGTKLSQMGEI